MRPQPIFGKLIVMIGCAAVVLAASAGATVVEKDGRVFLVDQTGENWDITQATSIGFEPGNFEFGIGRYAFKPLGEADWLTHEWRKVFDFRVIGIANGGDAHAYAVDKLARHETANTVLASKPVLSAY
jgi:hypothetical protein